VGDSPNREGEGLAHQRTNPVGATNVVAQAGEAIAAPSYQSEALTGDALASEHALEHAALRADRRSPAKRSTELVVTHGHPRCDGLDCAARLLRPTSDGSVVRAGLLASGLPHQLPTSR
jgi:hypothetical protein